MIQFKGFKPEAMQRIAGSLGYQGNMNGFNDYLNKNPDKMNAMNMYQDKAIQMANGGVVQNFNTGGTPYTGLSYAGSNRNFNVSDQISSLVAYNDSYSKDAGGNLVYTTPGTGESFTLDASKIDDSFTSSGFYPAGGGEKYFTKSSDVPTSTATFIPSGTQEQYAAGTTATNNTGTINTGTTATDTTGTTATDTTGTTGTSLTGGFVNTYDQTTGKYLYGTADNVQSYDTAEEYSAAVAGRNEPGGALYTDPAETAAIEAQAVANSQAETAAAQALANSQAETAAAQAALEAAQSGTVGTVTGVGNTGVGTFEGGSLPTGTTTLIGGIPQAAAYQGESISELQANRAINPGLPTGSTVAPVGTTVVADQLIGDTSGQVTGDIDTPITTAGTTAATGAAPTGANTMTATQISNQVTESLKDVGPAVGAVDPRAEVDAQAATDTSVSGLNAAQGTATTMDNPVQRKVEDGELISGVANAETAAAFSEEIDEATATPTEKATVQGQLDGLMQQFEGGNTPAWAAGSMRAATATMVSRGLGASSMAGQAIIQAAMEAALPIASADAQVYAQFESQNLSNRQQRAMLSAQQRAAFIGQEFDQAFQSRVMNASKVSDIANMNFTAEQQVALENSRNANTMNLSNLSNRQAIVMAEAAALSNLDMANLSNRQQAAVMNAQTFLQMDMANLNNSQQTTLFKSQQQIQSLFTDQAADNASKQFNATSENQTDQFFANLTTQVSQFNAAQSNAQGQFNAGQTNSQDRFASEMMNQRDQFNAQNRLVIDQQNANWRRQVATADTAAINRANEINAASILNMSNTAYNDLWSYYQDSMEYAWNSAENERGRISDMMITKLQIDAAADLSQLKLDYQASAGWGDLMANMFTSPIGGNTILGKGIDAVVDFLF